MRVNGYIYHTSCFACMRCDRQLQKGDEFALRSGRILCRLDFEKELIGGFGGGSDSEELGPQGPDSGIYSPPMSHHATQMNCDSNEWHLKSIQLRKVLPFAYISIKL